jgi:hypothetical protein
LENIYFKIQLEFVFKAIPTIDFFLETDTVDVHLKRYIPWAKYKTATVAELQELIAINYKTVFKKNK